jgi:hypothetical protein
MSATTITFWDELADALGAVPLMLPEDALTRLDDGRGLWPHLQREIIATPQNASCSIEPSRSPMGRQRHDRPQSRKAPRGPGLDPPHRSRAR